MHTLLMTAVSAAMAHAELYGHGVSAGSNEHGRVGDQHSDSATREYLSSLPGSPTSDREPPALPLVDVDWNDMENVFQHFPVTEKEIVQGVYSKEECQNFGRRMSVTVSLFSVISSSGECI